MIQYAISALSLLGLGLAYWPGRDMRFYAALSGLAAQPCWFYMIWGEHLWGIAPLAPVYFIVYAIAMKAHWSKR